MPLSFISNPVDFGRQYRAERKALGKTQSDVAKIVRVSRQTIADLENGKNVSFRVALTAIAAINKVIKITTKTAPLGELPDFFAED